MKDPVAKSLQVARTVELARAEDEAQGERVREVRGSMLNAARRTCGLPDQVGLWLRLARTLLWRAGSNHAQVVRTAPQMSLAPADAVGPSCSARTRTRLLVDSQTCDSTVFRCDCCQGKMLTQLAHRHITAVTETNTLLQRSRHLIYLLLFTRCSSSSTRDRLCSTCGEISRRPAPRPRRVGSSGEVDGERDAAGDECDEEAEGLTGTVAALAATLVCELEGLSEGGEALCGVWAAEAAAAAAAVVGARWKRAPRPRCTGCVCGVAG